ncbi:hypothetical protein RFK55_10580, partial [Streptococcus suis]
MRIGNWNLRHKIFNIKNFSYCAPLIIPIIITILSYKLNLIHSCSRGLNRTPKVRQKKSNIWGAIFMKLSYEDKIEIYELRQSG